MVSVSSLRNIISKVGLCSPSKTVYPKYLSKTKEGVTEVVNDLWNNKTGDYNVVRYIEKGKWALGSERIQTYDKSGKLLGTTRYPFNDNATLSTYPDGTVQFTYYKDGRKFSEQKKVKNLKEFIKYMKPRFETLFA